jgi:hypothetical protein
MPSGPTKTYDEWMAEDPTLAAGQAAFHAHYGTRALQHMDRDILDARILEMPISELPPGSLTVEDKDLKELVEEKAAADAAAEADLEAEIAAEEAETAASAQATKTADSLAPERSSRRSR